MYLTIACFFLSWCVNREVTYKIPVIFKSGSTKHLSRDTRTHLFQEHRNTEKTMPEEMGSALRNVQDKTRFSREMGCSSGCGTKPGFQTAEITPFREHKR
jgi:hypothetical protein